MSKKHAMHNWSSAKSWLSCDLVYKHKLEAHEKGLEWDKDSDASERGTLLHDISELAVASLVSDETRAEWSWSEVEGAVEEHEDALGAEILATDREDVIQSVTQVLGLYTTVLLDDPEAEIHLELSGPIAHEPESNFHADVVIVSPKRLEAWVVDYKYGRGPVDPDVPQLTGYACGVADWLHSEREIPAETFHRGIMQPIVGDEIKWADPIGLRDLVRFQHHVMEVVEHQKRGENLRGAAELSACEWCPAARLLMCRHRDRLGIELTTDLEKTDFGPLTNERIEKIVRNEKQYLDWIKELKTKVQEDEATFPNWKRIQVRNPLAWNPAVSVEELEASFAKKGLDPYVMGSPAQVRKKNPGNEELINSLCKEQGHHIRLKYEGTNK